MQHVAFLSKKILYIASTLACALAIFIGFYLHRAHFTALLVSMSAFFLIYTYFIAFFYQNESTFGWMRGLGILLRVILLFNIPNLSDDIYRFLWDGHLWLAGIHPFAFTPDEYVKLHGNLGPYESILYANMNSRAFFTVYPPVCQFIFALASWCSPNGILGSVIIIKLFLLLCEIGTIRLLSLLAGRRASVFYALNPLIVVELVGNCHFEAALIFFILMALWLIRKGRMAYSAMFLALSIASKLLPILFLPIIWRYLGWWRGFQYCVMVGIATFLCFIPIFNWEVLQHMASSLDLYFQKFQFNASIYYLCTLVGLWETGWQIGSKIGPWLGIATILGVVLSAFFTETKKKASWIRFESALLFASFLHLSLSSTVHSWYVSIPFVLGLLSKWHFPLTWTFLVLCSYSHYSSNIYVEKYPWIVAEYSLLWIILLFEQVRQLKPNASR
jgi:hypothetical protein